MWAASTLSRRRADARSTLRPGVVWDATGGPFNNRIYLVYTDETVNENNDTDIYDAHLD